MKKHVSDLPPTFAELGINITPSLERAVRRSLAKKREDRPQTVKKFLDELTDAVNNTSSINAQNIPAMINPQQDVTTSSLQIRTIPAQAQVIINNNIVGNSSPDGWLMLEGLQSGNHKLCIKREGFFDWQQEVVIDGSAKEVVAELQRDPNAIPMPINDTLPSIQQSMRTTPQNLSDTQGGQSMHQQSMHQQTGNQQNWQSGNQSQQIDSINNVKPPFLSPLVLATIGLFGLLLISAIGLGGTYFAGVFPFSAQETPTPTPTPKEETEKQYKNEMAEIPGGTFKMGNDKGRDNEKPEHEVTVESFLMDKTEVTNGEYYQFVKQTGYRVPSHFVNGKPILGQESYPVILVNL